MIANTSSQSASPEFSVAVDRSLINVEGAPVRHLVLTFRAPRAALDRPAASSMTLPTTGRTRHGHSGAATFHRAVSLRR